IIEIGGGKTPKVKVGGTHATCIAGPCAVENEEMLNKIARHVREGGATVLRGGVYKPRTSPYSFQGLGMTALKWMRACGDERGIKTFEDSIRYTLDVTSIPVAKQWSHLPIIVDPSHAAGKRDFVPALALAGMAAGAHGIIIEVHYCPSEAQCDGPQALLPEV